MPVTPAVVALRQLAGRLRRQRSLDEEHRQLDTDRTPISVVVRERARLARAAAGERDVR
ncbi:MAG TPA: hypothetical protein VEB59_12805 [Gemmatimonadales bacterium]|nr:hypothetical protein [Gemmatimonadales bacterium]